MDKIFCLDTGLSKLQSWNMNSLHSFIQGIDCSLASLSHLVQVTWRVVYWGQLNWVGVVELLLKRHTNVHGLPESWILGQAMNQLKLLKTKFWSFLLIFITTFGRLGDRGSFIYTRKSSHCNFVVNIWNWAFKWIFELNIPSFIMLGLNPLIVVWLWSRCNNSHCV